MIGWRWKRLVLEKLRAFDGQDLVIRELKELIGLLKDENRELRTELTQLRNRFMARNFQEYGSYSPQVGSTIEMVQAEVEEEDDIYV